MAERSNCTKTRALLAAYLDGEITPAERDLVRFHLSSCSACSRELELLDSTRLQLRKVLQVRAAEADAPSDQVWSAVRARIGELPAPSFSGRLVGWLRAPVWQAAVITTVVVAWMTAALWVAGAIPEESAPQPEVPIIIVTTPPPPVTATPTVTLPTTGTPPPVVITEVPPPQINLEIPPMPAPSQVMPSPIIIGMIIAEVVMLGCGAIVLLWFTVHRR